MGQRQGCPGHGGMDVVAAPCTVRLVWSSSGFVSVPACHRLTDQMRGQGRVRELLRIGPGGLG